MDWPRHLHHLLQRESCVVVTVQLLSGSAPRESGSRLLVTVQQACGSIGGGNLEYRATRQAREALLHSDTARQWHAAWGLGPKLNQCCGGAVRLHFEVMPRGIPAWLQALVDAPDDPAARLLASLIDGERPEHRLLPAANPLTGLAEHLQPALRGAVSRLLRTGYGATDETTLVEIGAPGETWWIERAGPRLTPLTLFGAGHVGHEVARLLERLPFAVRWVDQRPDALPAAAMGHIHLVHCADPLAQVSVAPPGSIFVVMTHSHRLDEDICHAVLQRRALAHDVSWLGLIGSNTKRRRFVYRLENRGIPSEQLAQLHCPIGLLGQGGGIAGKQPATIALSLAAQLMMERPWITVND